MTTVTINGFLVRKKEEGGSISTGWPGVPAGLRPTVTIVTIVMDTDPIIT